jgi:hypothetical protein
VRLRRHRRLPGPGKGGGTVDDRARDVRSARPACRSTTHCWWRLRRRTVGAALWLAGGSSARAPRPSALSVSSRSGQRPDGPAGGPWRVRWQGGLR